MKEHSKSDNIFRAKIEIIGINPFVFVPDPILNDVFEQAGRVKSPIPITGTINGRPYQQTLMKYLGLWRLYINTTMLVNSPKRIGETIEVTINYDPVDRAITAHPKLLRALSKNKKAKSVFDSLNPSLRNEMNKYISNLKTERSIEVNVQKAIDFLLGKGRFIGRAPYVK
jgi:hypothetical protein